MSNRTHAMFLKMNLPPPAVKDYNDKNQKAKEDCEKKGGTCCCSKVGAAKKNKKVNLDGNNTLDCSISLYSPSELSKLNPAFAAAVAVTNNKNDKVEEEDEKRSGSSNSSDILDHDSSPSKEVEPEPDPELTEAVSASKKKCESWLQAQQLSGQGTSAALMTPPKTNMPIVPYTPSSTATVMSFCLNDKENILSLAKKICETSPSQTKVLQTSGFITKPLLEKHQLNTLTLSENGNSCKLAPKNNSSILKGKRKEPINSNLSGCSRTVVLPMKKPKTLGYTGKPPRSVVVNADGSALKLDCFVTEASNPNINLSPNTNLSHVSTQKDISSDVTLVQENRKESLAKKLTFENLHPTSKESNGLPVKKAKTLGYNLKEKSNVRRGLLKSFNDCSSENDQVKSVRPKRKAAQSLRYDTADNKSEMSESQWDFDGSEFGDPTWGSGSKKSSESDEETGSDYSTQSPVASVSISPTRSEDCNSPIPLVNSQEQSVVNNSPAHSEVNESAPRPARRNGPTQTAMVKERQLKRNSGSAYTTSTNKEIKAKSMKALKEKCRLNCKERLSEDDRKDVFSEYWGQKDFDRRVSYIIGHVFEKPTIFQRKRVDGSKKNRTCTLKYELDIHNSRIEVCKPCFLATLGENDGFVKRALENKKRSVSGVMRPDARGRKPSVRKTPQQTTEAIMKHINEYPRYSSHYGRSHSSRMYLGAGVTIQGMFNDYSSKDNPKTSLSTYSRAFQKTGLKFKPPKVDTCNKCDAFEMSLKGLPITEQAEIKAERDAHHEKARLAYSCKKQDKADQTSESWVASFDLQQVLYCPHLTCGAVFYKRQLSVFNLTVFDCFHKKGINHMWTELEAGRGANEISSCITHFIAFDVPPGVKKLTLWSDTCSGQNKNSIVCAALISAVAEHPSIEVIDHKFLVAGHTHMECDQVHAEIEKKKKHTTVELHHPANFYNFVKTVEYRKETLDVVLMKDHFLKVSSLLDFKSKGPLVLRGKNQAGEPFAFSPVQWFRYQKKNPTVVLYKECHDVDEPFKEISFRRRGKLGNSAFKPSKCSARPRPISVEKKKDLIELLPQVNPLYHDFFKNILSSADAIDVNPDCLTPEDVTLEIDRCIDKT